MNKLSGIIFIGCISLSCYSQINKGNKEGSEAATLTANPVTIKDIVPVDAVNIANLTTTETGKEEFNSLKWHPGHYALFWQSPTDEQLEKTVFASPYLKGAQIVYSWDKLEPEKDRYDFSTIEKDLGRLQRHGKYLWVQIQRQGGGNPPAYLKAYVDKRTKTYAILEMPVMERYTILFNELGKRFDREPAFTAINSTETLGEPKRPDGEEEFVRAWTYFHERCRKYFPNTVVISYVTWGPGKDKVRHDLPKYAVGVGSPDVVPSNDIAPYDQGPPPQGSNPGHNSAPIYTEYDYLKGKVPVCDAVQRSELMFWHSRHGTFTLDQIYEMGVNKLGANYLSWAVESSSETIRHDFIRDIMPFLATKKGAINTKIPSTLQPDVQPEQTTGTYVSQSCDCPKNNLYENPFNKNSAFHRPIGTGAIYADEKDSTTIDWKLRNSIVINVGKSYGSVVANGTADDPFVTVKFDTTTPKVYGDGSFLPAKVHIPVDFGASSTSDGGADIFDVATDTLHEFYRLYFKDGKYIAALRRPISLRGLGHSPTGENRHDSVGVCTTGMSLAGGLLRGHEVNTRGYRIQHALNVCICSGNRYGPQQMAGSIVWPASGRDNFCGNGRNCLGHIPYGSLIALPPVEKGGPNLDTMNLSEPGRRVIQALRDYGMYVMDTSTGVTMRSDQYITREAVSQIRSDLSKIYKYFRVIKNNSRFDPVAGGGKPLAPNCAFDSKEQMR